MAANDSDFSEDPAISERIIWTPDLGFTPSEYDHLWDVIDALRSRRTWYIGQRYVEACRQGQEMAVKAEIGQLMDQLWDIVDGSSHLTFRKQHSLRLLVQALAKSYFSNLDSPQMFQEAELIFRRLIRMVEWMPDPDNAEVTAEHQRVEKLLKTLEKSKVSWFRPTSMSAASAYQRGGQSPASRTSSSSGASKASSPGEAAAWPRPRAPSPRVGAGGASPLPYVHQDIAGLSPLSKASSPGEAAGWWPSPASIARFQDQIAEDEAARRPSRTNSRFTVTAVPAPPPPRASTPDNGVCIYYHSTSPSSPEFLPTPPPRRGGRPIPDPDVMERWHNRVRNPRDMFPQTTPPRQRANMGASAYFPDDPEKANLRMVLYQPPSPQQGAQALSPQGAQALSPQGAQALSPQGAQARPKSPRPSAQSSSKQPGTADQPPKSPKPSLSMESIGCALGRVVGVATGLAAGAALEGVVRDAAEPTVGHQAAEALGRAVGSAVGTTIGTTIGNTLAGGPVASSTPKSPRAGKLKEEKTPTEKAAPSCNKSVDSPEPQSPHSSPSSDLSTSVDQSPDSRPLRHPPPVYRRRREFLSDSAYYDYMRGVISVGDQVMLNSPLYEFVPEGSIGHVVRFDYDTWDGVPMVYVKFMDREGTTIGVQMVDLEMVWPIVYGMAGMY